MSILTHFCGGQVGTWRVTQMDAVKGPELAVVDRITVIGAEPGIQPPSFAWSLRGFGSNQRYTTLVENGALKARQAGLGRAEAACAALIPIRKSERWWCLAQDERRSIFEERSHHGTIGMEYLPAVARRLFHCRDIGEPFDFLTWFEFAPEHAPAFENLLRRLRSTEEWSYVERESEIRLHRSPG